VHGESGFGEQMDGAARDVAGRADREQRDERKDRAVVRDEQQQRDDGGGNED